MMCHIALLLSLAVCLAGCGQKQTEQEQKAVDAILKSGGYLTRDEKLPWRPVVRINLSNTKVMDSDLKDLKELKGLRTLWLDDTQITDAGLKDLNELKGLLVLGLSRTQITDAGLKELKELKGLQWLYLSGTKITAAGLKELNQALPATDIFGP